MALSSGVSGSLTLDAAAQRLARSSSRVAASLAPCLPGASGPGGWGGGPMVRVSGGTGKPPAPPHGTTLGAALAVSTQWGVDGDPLPLARLPLQDAPYHPGLDVVPHGALPKGLSGFLRCTMLLARLHAAAS